jgi:hypothetical protein
MPAKLRHRTDATSIDLLRDPDNIQRIQTEEIIQEKQANLLEFLMISKAKNG